MAEPTTLDLFGEGPPPPLQRTSATSVAAAEAKKPTAGTDRAKLLEVIRDFGPITDQRAAEISGIAPDSVRPRRGELVKAGLIVAEGIGRTVSGRAATLWRVAGRAPAPPHEGADWSELAKRRPGWMGRAAFLDLVSKAVDASGGNLREAQQRVSRDLEALS